MRTTFYEIMRKRKKQHVRFLPWATFTCSMGTCSGLFVYGDRIECAVESVHSAPSIATLGSGIQLLHEASQEVMLTEGTIIQNSTVSLVLLILFMKCENLIVKSSTNSSYITS